MDRRLLGLVAAIITHRKLAISLGTLLALLCLPPAVLLYGNLKSALEELLPRSAPSIHALEELHRRLGDNVQLAVLVSGAQGQQLHRFADRFAERVRSMPHGAPRAIDYRPGEIQEFFGARKALFIDTQNLATIESRIKARIDWEVQQRHPLALHLEDEEPAPEVKVDDIVSKYSRRAKQVKVHPSGYYDGEDGQSLAMVFYPASGVTGYEASLGFRDALDQLGKQVAKEQGLESLKLEFAGDIQTIILEQRSLQSDLVTSSLIVLVAETLLLLTCFWWTKAFGTLGFPLSVATLATFAVSYAAIGSVNASTAFLGSIIVGNGINPGIILLARFLEERRRGCGPNESMLVAVRETAPATAVASAAAALSYAALMVTTFRGYSQFGFTGGLGMAVCWLTTYLLLPPTAVALDARWPVRPRPHHGPGFWDRLFGALARFSLNHSLPVLLTGSVLVVAATLGLVRFARDPFEYDTTKLMSRWATEPGGYLSVDKKIDRILAKVITPVVILADRSEDADKIAEDYRHLIDAAPPGLVLGEVFTAHTLVPADQPTKLAILGRIRHMLRGSRMDLLEPATRQEAQELLASADVPPFTAAELPEAVRRQFREVDGREGALVLLFPRSGADTRNGREVVKFAHEVRSLSLPKGAVASGSYLVFSDMLESIAHDGPLATVVALGAVILLSLWQARGARGTLAVTICLVSGVLLTVGMAALLGVRVNFLNFIALPITFGIGVDYAANIYGRCRRSVRQNESLAEAVSRAGGPVALCSATTVIGYSSLLFSRNGALFSFGLLAVAGEIACLLCALLLLPALLKRRVAVVPGARPLPSGARPSPRSCAPPRHRTRRLV